MRKQESRAWDRRNRVMLGAMVDDAGSTRKNMTGSWRTFRPEITGKCAGCGTCTLFCPEGAIRVKTVRGRKKAVVDYGYCKGCMICFRVCPVKAIEKRREEK